MNILISGASGFIGSHLAEKLYNAGHNICCTMRDNSSSKWLNNIEFEKIPYDLNEASKISLPSDIDFVIHSAGTVAAPNENEYLRINCDSSIALAEQVIKQIPNIKKFVYISSQAAMGPSPDLNSPLNENTTMMPITAYGRSKKAAENELQKINGLPLNIVAPSAVYGERDKAVLTIFQVAKYGLATHIGKSDKYVSLVNVHDLVNGIILVTEKAELGKKYFISSDEIYDWRTLLDKILFTLGRKKSIKIDLPHWLVFKLGEISEFLGKFSGSSPVFNKDKSLDITQEYWTVSVDKAKNELDYKQQISIDSGLRSTVDWYLKNKWL